MSPLIPPTLPLAGDTPVTPTLPLFFRPVKLVPAWGPLQWKLPASVLTPTSSLFQPLLKCPSSGRQGYIICRAQCTVKMWGRAPVQKAGWKSLPFRGLSWLVVLCFACQLMPCSFGHKDTRGLSTGLQKYPHLCRPHSCCSSSWAPTESEGVSSCLEPGRAGSQGPKGGGRRNDPEGTEAPSPGHMLRCPVRLHLQIMNSKIMLFKFLRCQLQRMKPQAQWLNVVVCAIALINILMKLPCRGTFLTRVSQ